MNLFLPLDLLLRRSFCRHGLLKSLRRIRRRFLSVPYPGMLSMVRPIAATADGPAPVVKKGEKWPAERHVSDDQRR